MEVRSSAGEMAPETAAMGKGTWLLKCTLLHTRKRVASLHFWKKPWAGGKSAFIWDALATGQILEGLKYTTTLSGSAKKDHGGLATLVVIELGMETALLLTEK